MTESGHDPTAEYVFRVVVRIISDDTDVRIVPDTFETTLFIRASEPGKDGWLFFRNVLWRGEVNAPDVVRRLAADALGEPVETVEFREFQAETAYFDALREEISTDLDLFNAETVEEAVNYPCLLAAVGGSLSQGLPGSTTRLADTETVSTAVAVSTGVASE